MPSKYYKTFPINNIYLIKNIANQQLVQNQILNTFYSFLQTSELNDSENHICNKKYI